GNVQVSTLDLVNTIAEVSNLSKNDYSNESWTALEGKVLEAKAIVAKLNATQEEIANAKNNVTLAMESLKEYVPVEVDKTQLISLVGKINSLDSSKYTSSTWGGLQAELEKVNAVLTDENATEEEVQDSYNNLSIAYNNLKLIVVIDNEVKENVKVEIEEIKAGEENVIDIPASEIPNSIEVTINDANALEQGQGSISLNIEDFATVKIPFEAFKNQITEDVEKVMFRMNVIENSDILEDLKAVGKVFEFNIVAVEGNEEIKISQFGDALVEVKLILTDADLEGLNKDNLIVLYYNEETKEFEDVEAIINGNEVTFKTSHFSKFIIAEKEVTEAVNKDKLQELINTAEAIDTSKYTEASVSKLKLTLDNVKNVLNNEEATQEEVNKAEAEIENAIKDLVVIEDNNNGGNNDGGNNDGGNNNGGNNDGGNNNGGNNNGGNNNGGNNNGGNNNGGNNNGGNNNGGSNNSGNNNQAPGKGLLPATGGVSPISIATISMLLIALGSVLLKKKKATI
ncbi:MAG: LPXTG cell wall anchor domain-containing protein, partial [Clostridium sp.]|uniref:LPXTG cell wall anchor domain-containing protein n=1 Tax=Clostridium sp. TaxID=1506 RepID=UPI0025BF861D